jgi:hypothetical protein
MDFLSTLILILLTLVSYSGGAVGKAGKSVELRPRFLDLFLVLVLWGGALYSRNLLELNHWLIVLIWMAAACLVGIMAVWAGRPDAAPAPSIKGGNDLPPSPLKRLMARWAAFSKRLGSFQGRMLLSFLYFLVVAPFAVGIRLLGDPLQLKPRTSPSFWNKREDSTVDMGSMRRQF